MAPSLSRPAATAIFLPPANDSVRMSWREDGEAGTAVATPGCNKSGESSGRGESLLLLFLLDVGVMFGVRLGVMFGVRLGVRPSFGVAEPGRDRRIIEMGSGGRPGGFCRVVST